MKTDSSFQLSAWRTFLPNNETNQQSVGSESFVSRSLPFINGEIRYAGGLIGFNRRHAIELPTSHSAAYFRLTVSFESATVCENEDSLEIAMQIYYKNCRQSIKLPNSKREFVMDSLIF